MAQKNLDGHFSNSCEESVDEVDADDTLFAATASKAVSQRMDITLDGFSCEKCPFKTTIKEAFNRHMIEHHDRQ